MLRTFFLCILINVCLSVYADRQADFRGIREFLQQNNIQVSEDADTVVAFQGYKVKIVQEKDSLVHIGLNLFNPELKKAVDEELLNFIERDLLLQLVPGGKKENSVIVFNVGNLSALKKVTSETPCNVSIQDGNLLMLDWIPEDGNHVLVSVPISYDLIIGGTRSEIENAFISRLRESHWRRSGESNIDPADLKPYGESEYVLPGETYINHQITRNKYLYGDKEASLIWDTYHPAESISNMFICGTGNGDAALDLTIIKHEYGDKEQIETSLENLLAVAEKEGCKPYWGLESLENGIMKGSLFLFNPIHGYDHVLKIECVPEEIIEGKGKIIAKAYLYIPSNNVSNLNEPYRVKSEDEKIKYWDN